eukprot:843406_1
MSSFKKVAHKLYSVQRNEEFAVAFSKLRQTTSTFSDKNVFVNLATSDSLEQFKLYWDLIIANGASLMAESFGVVHIMVQNGSILKYLLQSYDTIFKESIQQCINRHSALQMIQCIDKQEVTNLIQTLIAITTDENDKLFDTFLFNKDTRDDSKNGMVLMYICESGCVSALKAILNSQIISEDTKFKLLCDKGSLDHYFEGSSLVHACKQKDTDCSQCAIEILRHFAMDNAKLMTLLTNADSHDDSRDLQRNTFMQIVDKKEHLDVLKFILQCNSLTKDDKLKLFTSRDKDGKSVMVIAVSGLLNSLWEFSRQNYTEKQLAEMILMNPDVDNNNILLEICKKKSNEYIDILKWIFNTTEIEIGNEQILKLLANGLQSPLSEACRNGVKEYVFEILNYISGQHYNAYNVRKLFAIGLSQFEMALCGGWTPFFIFSATMLNQSKDGIMEDGESVFHVLKRFVKWLFANIQSEDLSELFNAKTADGKTCFDLTKVKLFKECMEYFEFTHYIEQESDDDEVESVPQFEQILDVIEQFTTNPIATMCSVGDHYQTMQHVFSKCVVKTEDKLKLLLTTKKHELLFLKEDMKDEEEENKHGAFVDKDYVEGNNCFMIAALNGDITLVQFMLNSLKADTNEDDHRMTLLSQRNKLNETLLMKLCQDEHNVDMIKAILTGIPSEDVITLLNQKNGDRGSCLEQANKANAVKRLLHTEFIPPNV